MKPKKIRQAESGPAGQPEDFEKSPDMAALDALTRRILKAGKLVKGPKTDFGDAQGPNPLPAQ